MLINIYTELTMQTTAQTPETTKTPPMMAERSSSMLTTTTKTWTAASFSSIYLALSSISTYSSKVRGKFYKRIFSR